MTVLKRFKRACRGIVSPNPPTTKLAVTSVFLQDARTGIKTRAYQSYEEYVEHQKAKLGRVLDEISRYDREYELIVEQRYRDVQDWRGKSVLCIAARLGGEVRAFRSLGALAIGIDLEPGHENPLVLHGDFHNMQFAGEVFDCVFSNAIDHAFDLPRLLAEACRVLKPQGLLVLEVCTEAPGKYESVDLSGSLDLICEVAGQTGLEHMESRPCKNSTSYTDWEGVVLTLAKRS